MPVSTRRSTARATMNQYTLFSADPAATAIKPQGFDAAAADLSAFFDLSSFTTAEHAPLVVVPSPEATFELGTGVAQPTSFTNAFGAQVAPGSAGALRPVDDSLLESPLDLDLELSPASFTSASSLSGSPFDFGSAADYTSPLLSSYGSPLVDSMGAPLADMPSLFAPAPSSLGFAAPWNPQDVVVSAPAPTQQVFAPAVSSPMEDVKPILPRLDSTGSLLFDFGLPAAAPAPAPAAIEVQPAVEVAPAAAAEPAPASTPAKRKTVAQLKKEAALLVEDKAFKPDNFKGFRNTKKPMISYDAPTLPKNYLTESATSRKRTASGDKASTLQPASKRARSSSAVPQVELPQTQAEPIAADDLDEEQLSAIELKRRMNTLAARRSRMRKAEFLKSLQDEISSLKMLNEELQRENARLKEKCGE